MNSTHIDQPCSRGNARLDCSIIFCNYPQWNTRIVQFLRLTNLSMYHKRSSNIMSLNTLDEAWNHVTLLVVDILRQSSCLVWRVDRSQCRQSFIYIVFWPVVQASLRNLRVSPRLFHSFQPPVAVNTYEFFRILLQIDYSIISNERYFRFTEISKFVSLRKREITITLCKFPDVYLQMCDPRGTSTCRRLVFDYLSKVVTSRENAP